MISQNIQYLRQKQGMTQEGLAQEISVSRQTVAKWESGDSLPDIENLSALAELFNVTLDDLVHHDEHAEQVPIPPRDHYVFGVLRIDENRRIQIPEQACEVFDLGPGSDLLMLGDRNEGIALVKVDDALSRMEPFTKLILAHRESEGDDNEG